MSTSYAARFSGELFCVEIRTARWAAMVAWYRDTLGLRSLVRVSEDRYALLAAGASRLALVGISDQENGKSPSALVFEVPNLTAAEESLYTAGERILRRRIHPEGFHELTLNDPDGNCVRLIAWPSE